MYARIENGVIVDRRSQPTADGDWRPILVEGRQPFDPDCEREAVEILIDADRVRQVFRVEQDQALRAAAINRERDRRLQLFPFGGKQFDFNETSRIDIAGAGSLAQGAIMAGAQPGDLRWADDDTDFRWIAADNSAVTMDAQTCFAFAQAAARWRADHICAARALKDQNPIPETYTDDSHWPQG